MTEVIYSDERVEIEFDLAKARNLVRSLKSGQTWDIDARCTLSEPGPNAREACLRAGLDPSRQLVASFHPILLPIEVAAPWADAARRLEAARAQHTRETEASWSNEFRSALARFGSSAAAWEAEAMREYEVLLRGGA